MKLLVVAYDVPNEKRRRKVYKALLRLGSRVQYSVFLVHRASAQEVAAVLAGIIAPAEDDVRIHPLCAACAGRARLLGKAREADVPVGFRVV